MQIKAVFGILAKPNFTLQQIFNNENRFLVSSATILVRASILVLLMFDLTDTYAQYIENQTQLTEKGETYTIYEKDDDGLSDFNRISLQKGETINTDIFGYGGLILTISVVGFFLYVKIKKS